MIEGRSVVRRQFPIKGIFFESRPMVHGLAAVRTLNLEDTQIVVLRNSV
jgi:hypothetical protein